MYLVGVMETEQRAFSAFSAESNPQWYNSSEIFLYAEKDFPLNFSGQIHLGCIKTNLVILIYYFCLST